MLSAKNDKMSYEQQRTIPFSSVHVKTWCGRKGGGVDVFACDRVMLPISIGGVHWVAVVVDLRARRFEYLDSLHGKDNAACVATVRRWLNDEAEAKKGAPIEGLDRWPTRERKDIPKQLNGCDCGVFLCLYARALAMGERLTGGGTWQRGMVKHRRALALEILRFPEKWHAANKVAGAP